ncbi:YcgN family cysteine cluster protein [Pseudoroseicyclus sp. CXY001]|uniref:YcgN family cysteine cluster protein n=1 Tax=Pseudoroseicyclus sp. CXY001 TaxID=3242492 RepID=UPI003570A8CF
MAETRPQLRPDFWRHYRLDRLTTAEWEALCDGCGKCCLNKLEDADTGEVALTRVSCRLLDSGSCLCRHYETRRDYVPECIQLTPKSLQKHLYWLPATCAYRLVHEGEDLYDWHHLKCGDRQAVHRAGISIAGQAVSEAEVPEEDWEEYIIEEPGT